MTFSSSDCSSNLELGLFTALMIFALLFIISMVLVFINEIDEKKSSWKYIPLIWLWPLRPFWTSKGLSNLGKKWRPVYVVSLSASVLVSSIMYHFDYCHS